MRGRIRQGIHDLQLLDDRAGPAVCNDERQRIVVFGANVNEMNIELVDLRHELRQGIELRFDLAPVIFARPVARERLHCGELNALRLVRDGFAVGPTGRSDSFAQIDQGFLGNADAERPNSFVC
jgi:hypothetical protein